jgi:hypothetical protein
MRARYIKIILWASALLAVWELGRSDAVTNALFLFATVGVVPGTNVVLSPEQVYVVLGAILAVSILLIFGSNIIRGIHALFTGRISLDEPEPATISGPVPATETPQPQAVVVMLPAQPGRLSMAWRRTLGVLVVGTLLLISWMQRRYPHAMTRLNAARSKAASGMRATWQAAKPRLRHLLASARIWLRIAKELALATAVHLWYWLEPRLHQFDRWLEKQFHRGVGVAERNETVVALRPFFREFNRMVNGWVASLRAMLGRLPED